MKRKNGDKRCIDCHLTDSTLNESVVIDTDSEKKLILQQKIIREATKLLREIMYKCFINDSKLEKKVEDFVKDNYIKS